MPLQSVDESSILEKTKIFLRFMSEARMNRLTSLLCEVEWSEILIENANRYLKPFGHQIISL